MTTIIKLPASRNTPLLRKRGSMRRNTAKYPSISTNIEVCEGTYREGRAALQPISSMAPCRISIEAKYRTASIARSKTAESTLLARNSSKTTSLRPTSSIQRNTFTFSSVSTAESRDSIPFKSLVRIWEEFLGGSIARIPERTSFTNGSL